ncbi:Homoserine dehydrogenase [Candidatus Desulfarcum epimagneticum]|uniref:Homoserine dehydrogenase n=1 Tax=uncultured Desulfobacteraceae bacterium TaxID=218296 RepID=A0A484HGL2_9BACT|nr:Homoserine dehydrogenase [uncultured Desulfobacteraceae bacterium]
MKHIKIGLIGLGTVGAGVAKILFEKKELISSRLGACLDLVCAVDLDESKKQALSPGETVFSKDPDKVLEDPDIDIIVEMIGGTGVAGDFILRAIESGKHVVTANKALLADRGRMILARAAEKGVDVGFEASAGGCMPIVKTIRESMVGNEIEGIAGILNGTCNYILSRMWRDRIGFDEALKDAMEKGFAEADPSLDISGEDSAHKLAILTQLAHGVDVKPGDIYVEGIEKIEPIDIAFAEEFGFRIKLMAISKRRGDAIEARVHPAMIPVTNLLARVEDNLNAVTLSGDATGDILLYGYGAGMMPTASVVAGDIADIARNMLSGASGRTPFFSCETKDSQNAFIMPIKDIRTHHYIRISALDRPGVLSRVAGALGDHHISIRTVHQKGRRSNGAVPVVMLTHKAKESDMKAALSGMKDMAVVDGDPVLIRIEENA